MSDVIKLTRDEKKFEEVLRRFHEGLGLNISAPDPGTGLTAFSQIGRQEDNSLAIDVAYKLHLREASEGYDMLQTEPLLQEALALLDRALSDRVAHAALGVEQLRAAFDAQEFILLDRINRQRDAAGYYELDKNVLLYQVRGEREQWHAQNRANEIADEALNRGCLASGRREALGKLNGAAAYSAVLPFLDPPTPKVRWPRNAVVSILPPQVSLTQGNEAEEVASKAAYENAVWSIDAARIGYEMSLGSGQHLAAATGYRIDEAAAKIKYEEQNVNFKRAQTQASCDVFDARMAETTRPNSVLNYGSRMKTIEQRFETDCQDAYDRLVAVKNGIASVYGALSGLEELPEPGDVNVFDLSVRFARSAHNVLSKIARRDQNYVMTFSIRAKTSREEFENMLSNGWVLQIAQEQFPRQRSLRLRGLSAFVRDKKGEHVYTINIMNGEQKVDLWLGRVGRRTDARDADIVGLMTLHNRSPIGEWKIALHPGSVAQALSDELEDVELDLFLAVQPA